jgi:heme-degrading monooxygenase HmoA
MFARIVTAPVEPDRIDEAVSQWRASVAPTAVRQTGFRGARLLVDRRQGRVLSIGLWDSEADFEASAEWNRGQLDQFRGVLSGAPAVAGYEVAAEAP